MAWYYGILDREAVVLQIIGTKKCPETRKALRFCKERTIECQFVDLDERKLSPGEWEHVFRVVDAGALVDTENAYYKKEGYAWRDFEASVELQEHPQLLKTPLVRCRGKVVVGFNAPGLLDLAGRS
jgi:arsenate reductase-like glutaredoxin family protein